MSLEAFNAGHIVILTGAGISAESGIETFRDKGGIWEGNNIDDVATPEAFDRDPARVHEFYNARRRALGAPGIQPNAAHKALALLEKRLPSRVMIVTQNIDDLHERAGTRNLIHMHGELYKARCAACGDVRKQDKDLAIDTLCRRCQSKGAMRPHVVWFGEMPLQQDRIAVALDACLLFVSIGTSGNVYPAAGFVHEVRMAGRAHTAELNLQPSAGESLFAERHYGQASQIVPRYVERILAAEIDFAPS